MVKKKDEDKGARPSTTPEGREQQLIALAVNLAEKQLRDGSASPSVINHYLKMASRREVLERDILEKQSKLIDVKAQSIVNDKDQEQFAKAALEAMRKYKPSSD
jgi:type I restriction-modification system DNA methylase subunit